METHLPPLLVVLAAAAAAPLIGEVTRRLGVSIVVLEILLGVAIGPQGLGWAASVGSIPFLALFGMAFLFFLAGLEIDLGAIRGAPLSLAAGGWGLAFVLACVVAMAMQRGGLVHAWLLVAIALVTTALGVVVPILRDTGELGTEFGRYVLAVGVLGELGPILAASVALSTTHTAGFQTAATAIFMVIVLAVAAAVVRGTRLPAFGSVLQRTMTQSSQLPVRLAVLLLAAFVVVAEKMAMDLAIGALAAGMVIGVASRGSESQVLHHKLDALGFGLLVPVFFINSGMKLDVVAIFQRSAGLFLLVAFVVALLVVRAPLVLLHQRKLDGRRAGAVGLFSATTLPLIVALTEIGVSSKALAPAEAAPLVGAGMLSVILFPILAMRLAPQPLGRVVPRFDDRDGL
jgi:Kef-type K+ transport system membrane component KefB